MASEHTDIMALMNKARSERRVGSARKIAEVDARPAVAGEVIVTRIAGEGVETASRVAVEGDWVVSSTQAETGNETYLIDGNAFAERYRGPAGEAVRQGWQRFRARGKRVHFFFLPEDLEPFWFTAPWGEPMQARGGDAIVQDPDEPADIYRIAARAFAGTYEVLEAPSAPPPSAADAASAGRSKSRR